MINRLLSFSIQAHWFIVCLTGIVAAYGSYELSRLPLDALPDITNKQVMINYAAPALGPEDIEKRITFPIETAISGLAGVESTRSFSRNGYGQVTAIFRETANLYFMRQQVAERLGQAKPNLPPGVEPQLGPRQVLARFSCTASNTLTRERTSSAMASLDGKVTDRI
jgi:cobalt-zinc-cadmium resistance protein CzcA